MSDQLSPPWVKYPELPRYAVGWHMHYGEEYLLDWWAWWEGLDTGERIEYFRGYKPLPMEWLDWIAAQFGFDAGADAFDDVLSLDGIRWLEKQGLVEFAEFQKWYDKEQNQSSRPASERKS